MTLDEPSNPPDPPDRPRDLIDALQRDIQRDPLNIEAHYALGTALYAAGQYQQGIACWQTLLNLDPTFYKAHNDLGAVLSETGLFESAERHLRSCIELAPRFAVAYYNLGLVYERQGQYAEAIGFYRQSIALDPEARSPHLNLSIALLMTGDLPGGLAEYQWRWIPPRGTVHPQPFTQPEWRGEDISGQTLLVYADQGMGDTLHFVRYCKLVRPRCGRVLLMVQPSLVSLLQQVEGAAAVISNHGQPLNLPSHDKQVPLLNLPYVLGTTLESIPAEVPYLRADPARAAVWRDRLAKDRNFKVGITWAGRSEHHNDRNRSTSLKAFGRLLTVPGVTFYSLQKGPAAAQIRSDPRGMLVVNCDRLLNDFADSAALVDNLDLIISVDTSIVHLAGAMGRPVWTLLPLVPDWRWLIDRTDSPWYPTMRLFRQKKLKDWAGVFEEVAVELTRTMAGAPTRA